MLKPVAALAGLLLVAACGGGTASPSTAQAQPSQSAGARQPRQGPPGVSGLLAAISGNTLQVQTRDQQTAVTFSNTTEFTDTVKVSLAQVTVGSCVMARSADASRGSGEPTSVAAASVSVTAAVDGSCTAALGGGRAGGPGRLRPSSAPNRARPSGAPGNGFGGGAFGKVISKSATGFVVESARPGSAGSATTQKVTVTTTDATVYTAAKKATAAALKLGKCVTARGKADSSGTVAATAISLRPATNGSCTAFGGPGA